MNKKIVILGTGPCGLGTAWRLQELGYISFQVFEKQEFPGGLAASFQDEKGFTWDIGGHVQFSHYSYFDELMDDLLKKDWLTHQRQCWVWMRGRFIPYPLQNNIKFLPKEEMWKCLAGLIELYKNPLPEPNNFREWILATFGRGIAESFLFPYNFKVWAYPVEKMSYKWIGERVAVTDLERVAKNIIFDREDAAWGPNSSFRFPLKGGTGEIWRRLFARIDKKKVHFNHEAITLDAKGKKVYFRNGHKEHYDLLISTIPLDKLLKMTELPLKNNAEKLLHSSTHVFGIGLKGKVPAHLRTKCWIYFPEQDCPFYRVTVFSNYSPNNVPDHTKYWSLMAEVSESPEKSVDRKALMGEVINGMLKTRLIEDEKAIVDTWYHFEPYGYPTPSLERDEALKALKELEKKDIYSRGRFGAWKYEVSNQDHSLMQGVEVVNRLIKGEKELTVWEPEVVNRGKK